MIVGEVKEHIIEEVNDKESENDLKVEEEEKDLLVDLPQEILSSSETALSVDKNMISLGCNILAPSPPERNLKNIKKYFKKAEESYRVPMPPPVSITKFKKVVEKKKKDPPPAPLLNYKLLRETRGKVDKKLDEDRNDAHPAPVLNYKTLRNAKENMVEHLEDTRHLAEEEQRKEEEIKRQLKIELEENERRKEECRIKKELELVEEEKNLKIERKKFELETEKKKEETSIMGEDELQKLKNKLIEAKHKEVKQEPSIVKSHPPLPPSHQRQHEVREIINIESENIDENPPNLSKEISPLEFKFENEDSSFQNRLSQPQTQPTFDNTEEFRTSLRSSNPHIMVDENEIIENSEIQTQRISPKFINENIEKYENTDLNNRDQQFEDLKINKMLVSNIENLELELKTTHKRINYLEEYNNQLLKSKNTLYSEKEDLIKRSIEFEYIQTRLEEKENRLGEIELVNARKSKEIIILRKDNES